LLPVTIAIQLWIDASIVRLKTSKEIAEMAKNTVYMANITSGT